MRYLFLLLLFTIPDCKAQTLTILDANTHKPIPFATLLLKQGDKTVYGNYAGEDGVVSVPSLQYERLVISCIGYEEKKFTEGVLSEKVYLNPKVTDLQEVVIVKSIIKPKEVSYGSFDERTKFLWFCFPKTELIVFMKPDEKLTNSSVKTIRIPVASDKRFDELETDKYIFRLTIYDAKKDAMMSEILEVSKEQILNDAVSYSPESELLFPNDGLYFGVELLGWDSAGKFLDNSYYVKGRHSLSLRFSKTKDYNTFYHTPFKGNGAWQLVEERVEAFQLTFDKPIGLSLGLILNKYN